MTFSARESGAPAAPWSPLEPFQRRDLSPAMASPADAGAARPSDSPAMDPAASTLLVRLAEVLHDSGVGTPRVEEAVMQCARAMGLEAQVLATPTSLMLSIGAGPVQMRRASQGSIHLARLDALDDLWG